MREAKARFRRAEQACTSQHTRSTRCSWSISPAPGLGVSQTAGGREDGGDPGATSPLEALGRFHVRDHDHD